MINRYDPGNPNSGHGHVYPRPDQNKARCGGPRMCRHCAEDWQYKQLTPRDTRLVTVCAECLQASCWQGIFMCDKAQNADTLDLPVYELQRLNREHPCYWKLRQEATP